MERDGPSVPPPQRRQVPPLCPARVVLRLSPHCHLRSLSPVRGSLSLAALLALPPSVKRYSRAGFPNSRSLWCCCTKWATLIWRLPSLPKFSYVILNCPPSHVSQACSNVDCTIREALESILGGPLTDWSSLPSSRGGFQPAECLAPCPCRFPGIFPALPDASEENAVTCPSTATSHCCCPVLSASSRPDWQSLEDIDVPLHQHSLSVSIDEAVHHPLLPCPCPGPLDCSTSCWGLAEQGSHLLFWVSIFTTRRVPLLPEGLAGCATPQHLLLLP